MHNISSRRINLISSGGLFSERLKPHISFGLTLEDVLPLNEDFGFRPPSLTRKSLEHGHVRRLKHFDRLTFLLKCESCVCVGFLRVLLHEDVQVRWAGDSERVSFSDLKRKSINHILFSHSLLIWFKCVFMLQHFDFPLPHK